MLKKLSRILPFFIVTLLCIGGVELLYGVAEHFLLLPVSKTPAEGAAVIVPGTEARELEKHKNYKVILDRNLFQSYSRQPGTVEPAKENPLVGLEATSLDLVLMGTISGPQDRSRAIIMEKSKKKQDIYYRGDVVQGAQIKEILRAKVILTYQGKDEILDMSEASKYKPRQSAAVAPTQNRKKMISSSPRPRKRVVPTRIKTRQVRQTPPGMEVMQEAGSDSDSDAAEPVVGQDSEPVEKIENVPPGIDEGGRPPDSDANGREQPDN